MTAVVLRLWRDNTISCATLPALIVSFSGSELPSLCFLAQQGAQPWTGPLAVAWQVILPNRICILAAAVLGTKNEYMEANCAYTDIAQAQPFRTQVDDRVAHKLSIWKELVLVAKKNVQGQSSCSVLVNWIYWCCFTAEMLLEPQSCFVTFHLPESVVPTVLLCGNMSLLLCYFCEWSWSSLKTSLLFQCRALPALKPLRRSTVTTLVLV